MIYFKVIVRHITKFKKNLKVLQSLANFPEFQESVSPTMLLHLLLLNLPLGKKTDILIEIISLESQD